MMEDGLHVGLAAWIHEQRRAGGFAACPISPIPTALVGLEAIQDVRDLAQASEFARLVNVVPRQGQAVDAFSAASMPLWVVHRDVLSRMQFATEPWTSAERVRYQAARDVLYTHSVSGRPAPSQALLLYEEMRKAYEDLLDSGAGSADLAASLTDWLVLGCKQAVEDAIATILGLSSRSSRTQAQDELALLEPSRLLVDADMSFASTYFAPISAMARETWLEATVSFADLDRAVDAGPDGSRWQAFRANRDGEIVFDYVVLTCLRPWYTPALYDADDWRLGDAGRMVSKGNGTDGLLPAYVDTVYLASVKNVTDRRPPPRVPGPGMTPWWPRPAPPVLAGRAGAFLAPLPVGGGEPGEGVVRRAVSPAPTAGRPVPSAAPTVAGRVLTAEVEPTVLARSGELRRLTAVAPAWRSTVVRDFLAGRNSSPSPVPDAPAVHV